VSRPPCERIRESFQALVDRRPRDQPDDQPTAMYALREVPDRHLRRVRSRWCSTAHPGRPEKISLLRATPQPVELQLARFEFLRSHGRTSFLACRLPLRDPRRAGRDKATRTTATPWQPTEDALATIEMRAPSQAVEEHGPVHRAARRPGAGVARYLAGR
jgi:hypothetical protein